MLNPEKNWHEILHTCPPHLLDVATIPCKSKKSSLKVLFTYTSDYLHHLRRKQTVTHLPTPPENVTTLTCEMQYFSSDWSLVACWWLWKEPVVMCGNWTVRQATSQQAFIVTTFCVDTCSHSFSPLISRIVHHSLLKFSPWRNQPLRNSSVSRTGTRYTRLCLRCCHHDQSRRKSSPGSFGGGRVSRSRHCSRGAQPVPKAACHSGCRVKHNRLRWGSHRSMTR